jgi:uncharacterized membrane protein
MPQSTTTIDLENLFKQNQNRSLAAVILLLLFAVGMIFFTGWLFQLFWNYAIVYMLVVAMPINYWTAMIFVVLFWVIFGSSYGIYNKKHNS